jgi:hypothetical protein
MGPGRNQRSSSVAIALPFHQKVLTGFQQDEALSDVVFYVSISIFSSRFNKREHGAEDGV